MEARTEGATLGEARSPQCEGGVASLIELSDEEILAWLSTSVLDEFELSQGSDALGEDRARDEFWDQVAALEANLEALGYQGPDALQRAIGFIGVDASMNPTSPGLGANSPVEALGGSLEAIGQVAQSPGERDLVQLYGDLFERAQRAVSVWASMQGSALRAALNARG